MLWLLRYIKGFLMIEIWGDTAEQLINRAVKNRILLWNLEYMQNKIICSVTIKDFKKIFNLHKFKGVNIKINNKIGLPFIMHRYRRRFGFVIGGVIFLVLLEFLSSFIWTIQIDGNQYVSAKEILTACEKIGVCEGTPIKKINTKNAADRLLLNLSDLAWSSFNIEGCLLTVNVTEVKNQPDEDLKKPTNIIALETGVIKKIDVTSGNVLVNVGDTVAKGDVLVSGIIENMNSTVFVNSRGVVTAQVEKTFFASGKFNETINHRTGKVKNRITLGAFSLELPLYFGMPKENAEIKTEVQRLEILKRKLPFYIKEDRYYLTEQRKITNTSSELKEKLYENIKKQLAEYKNAEVTVINEEYKENTNGAELTVLVSLVTDISLQKEITVLADTEQGETPLNRQ